MTAREDVAAALFSTLTTATAPQWVTKGRRLRIWTDVPATQRPAMFLVEHHETYAQRSEKLTIKEMEFNIFVYLNTKSNSYPSGGAQLNAVMDQIDAALAPTGGDILRGPYTNTLGGLVQHCFISGAVIKVPGDLDGDGLLVIPVKVLVP